MKQQSDSEPTETVMSRCHKYKGGFIPEEGSAADKRRSDHMHTKGYGTKLHVLGSDCGHVRGKFSFMHSERTFAPNHFETKPREQCCKTCVEYYHENYEIGIKYKR